MIKANTMLQDPSLLFVFALRILIPLTIFRWPLFGAVLSLLTDAFDVYIAGFLGTEITNYVQTDKLLDLYYLTIELLVSLRWASKLAQKTSIVLYIWRLLGVIVLMLVPNSRMILMLTPNLFENFFIFYLVIQKLNLGKKGQFWLTKNKLIIVLILLLLIKLPQEYLLHVMQIKHPVGYLFPWLPPWLH